MTKKKTKSRVERWLNEFKNTNTRKNYTWSLRSFFDVSSEATLIAQSEKFIDACLSGEKTLDDIKDTITDFIDRVEIKKNGTPAPPKSIWARVQVIKLFLEDQDVTIPKRWFTNLKNRRFQNIFAVQVDYMPKNSELKTVFSYMAPHGRALFGLLAASGCRIGEAMELRVKDVVLDHDSLEPHVRLRAGTTKNKRARLAFVTEEVKHDITVWLSVRDLYLERVIEKTPSKYKRAENDTRLFPFSVTTAYIIWKVAVRKAGLLERDERTDRYTLHPHVLRKWVRTRLATVLTQDLVEGLIGHSSYLSREYLRFSDQDLSDAYKKGKTVLHLNTMTITKEELDIRNDKVESLEARIASLENLIKQVATDESTREWIVPEIYEEATSEEARVQKKIFTEIVSTPEGRAALNREADEIKEARVKSMKSNGKKKTAKKPKPKKKSKRKGAN